MERGATMRRMPPTLVLICGLPGAGKTTLAKQIERDLPAVRLTPDDRMNALSLNLWDEETRAQIARLCSLERELGASIDYLDTCDTCDPDELVAACTDCHVRDRTQEEPELVAGIHGGNGASGRGGDRSRRAGATSRRTRS